MEETTKPQIVVAGQPGEQPDQQPVTQPAKLIRIASMIRELVEEVRQTSLDEKGSKALREIYTRSVGELKEALTEDLQQELDALAVPLEQGSSESEIRVAQAQLLGWLEGLFHGIQAALWAQHMQAQAALQEMRRRGLPSGIPGRPAGPSQEGGQQQPEGPPGQYL